MSLDEDSARTKTIKKLITLGGITILLIGLTIVVFQQFEEPKPEIDREKIFDEMTKPNNDFQVPVGEVVPTSINFFEVYKCSGESVCEIQFNMEVYFSDNTMILVQGMTPDELQNNILDAKYNRFATEQMLEYMWERLDMTHQEDFWMIYDERG